MARLLTRQSSLRRARFTLESVITTASLGATTPITTTGEGALVLPDDVQVRLGGPAYASVGDAEVVVLGGDRPYFRLGQQWLALDSSSPFAALLPSLGGSFNPDRALAGVTEVRADGSETVRGVSTSIYAFTLGATQLRQPTLPGAPAAASATWSEGTGRVWIGADGYVHRLTTTLRGRTTGGAEAVGATTLDFTAFDDPGVVVALPPGVTPVAVNPAAVLGSPTPRPGASASPSPAPGR